MRTSGVTSSHRAFEASIIDSFDHPRNGWAACQLARHLRIDRRDVDLALRRLRRKGLVRHRGAWELTDAGRQRYAAAYAA